MKAFKISFIVITSRFGDKFVSKLKISVILNGPNINIDISKHVGLCGHDKDGYPVAYEFPGLIDVKGFDSSMTNEEFVTQVRNVPPSFFKS